MKKTDTPTEYQEACCFVDWLELMKAQGKIIDYCHIANESYGGTRADMLRGMKLKRQGRKKGVFDYEVYIKTPPRELKIELKRQKGYLSKVSDEQERWRQIYEACKIPAAVCYGAQEAIDFVEEYLC